MPFLPSPGRASASGRARLSHTALHRTVLVHEVADGGGVAVVGVQDRAGADERGRGGVILLEQRRRRRDEGEVELDEALRIEVRKRLPEEVDPVAHDEHGVEDTASKHKRGRTGRTGPRRGSGGRTR